MLMGYLRELHGEFYYFMGRYIPHGVIIGAIEDRIVAVIYQYLTSLSSGKCAVKMLSKMNSRISIMSVTLKEQQLFLLIELK